MKQVVFILILVSTFTVCSSQKTINSNVINFNSKLDTLQKYSYLIIQTQNPLGNEDFFLEKKRNLGNATGFFAKIKNKLFFITNYHVMTGVDVYRKERYQVQFDTLKIRYFDKKNNTQYYSIDLNPIKKNSRIISFLEYPDIYIYEIKNFPLNAKIFSIEKFIYGKGKKQSDQKIAFSYQFCHGDDYVNQQIMAFRSEILFQSNTPKAINLFNSENGSPIQISSPFLLSNYSTDTIRSFGIPKTLSLFNSENGSPIQISSPFLLSNYSTDTIRSFDISKTLSLINSENGSPIKNTMPFEFSYAPNPNANILDKVDFSNFSSSFYSGSVIDLNNNNLFFRKVDSLYLVINPSTYHGSSGSPVFYLCQAKEKNKIIEWIEFAGVQSGIK